MTDQPEDSDQPPSGEPRLAALSLEQQQVWKAVRARLAVEASWLTGATFRVVPVAVTDAPTLAGARGAAAGRLAQTDRWGRVYLDFAAAADAPVARLAADAQAAVLDWLSDNGTEQPWFAARHDERFDVVAAADVAGVARGAASAIVNGALQGLARDAQYSSARSPLAGVSGADVERWQEWAQTVAGVPRVPWRALLRSRVGRCVTARLGYQERTYRRPSRIQSPGVILPSWQAASLEVALVVDVSGSMEEVLPAAVAEVGAAVAACGVEASRVTVITVDDEVVEVSSQTRGLPSFAGRAGHATDLRPGLLEASGRGRAPRADLVVVVTDGLTPWPDRAPGAEVVVVLLGSAKDTAAAQTKVPGWVSVVLEVDPQES